MKSTTFNEKELTAFRKASYWRGFRVALLVTVPFIITLMIFSYILAMNA